MIKKLLSVKALVLFVSVATTQFASAQDDSKATDDSKVYVFAEKAPKYPGGDAEMYNFISKKTKYPAEDLANANEGKVFVSFVVNKEGNVTDVKVEKGVTDGLNAEAVRVVSLLSGFTPATQLGKNVNYKYVIPISFKHGLSENQVWKIRKRQAKEAGN